MTIFPAGTLDYTDKDFASINRRLELLLQGVFPAWTDFERASFGNILKECFAFAADILCFYQDQQAQETRWGTAQLRSSIIELARLIGYELASASAATADVVFSIPRVTAGNVIIPAGTQLRTLAADPVYFQTTASATITAGATTSGSVTAKQSEDQQDVTTAAGEKSEEFRLTQRPFLDNTAQVTIAGNPWSQVDHFLDSGPTDLHFVVLVDAEDYATIRTGDGINGAFPGAGDSVVIDYETGGGTAGNVDAGMIAKVEGGPWYDTLSNPVVLSVSNALAATGGVARESVAEARQNAPRSIRVLNRAVARTDYEDLAVQVAGVGRALMLTKVQDPSISEEGYGYLRIVPDGGGTPSAGLKLATYLFIQTGYPPPLNFRWEVADPIYETIDIVAYVYLESSGTQAQVEADALAALRAFFAPVNDDGTANTAINFGYYYQRANPTPGEAPIPDPKVPLSTIANILHDLTGVRRLGATADGEGLTLNGLEGDVVLALNEFPAGGNLTLIDGDTGLTYAGHPIAL